MLNWDSKPRTPVNWDVGVTSSTTEAQLYSSYTGRHQKNSLTETVTCGGYLTFCLPYFADRPLTTRQEGGKIRHFFATGANVADELSIDRSPRLVRHLFIL